MIKILLIEDETILRDEVIEWLMLEGYETVAAGDGLEGVQQALQYQPDLIICDITMPHLDGHGVLLEIRSHPVMATVPFIFVTARASHEDIRKGMALGADDYLTKPFKRLELLDAVQSRLDKAATVARKLESEIRILEDALVQEHERRLLNTKLVAMFSHDFRNPLASILSSNSMLRDYGERMERERQEIHYDRVENSARRLIQMLDDMLVVAQMDTGKLEFEPEFMNLEEFFQEIVNEFQAIYGETRSLIFESGFHQEIAGDHRMLRQIAANLISNAVKYSPKGSEIRISLKQQDDFVLFKVQDDGIGIPEADLSRIFASFERASNVGSIAGTGLGLAIVQQAVELHNGTIHLESEVNGGTTVTVRIPV